MLLGGGFCCYGFPLPHDCEEWEGTRGEGDGGNHTPTVGWGRDCTDSHQPGPSAPTVTGTLPWQNTGPVTALGVPLAEAPHLHAKPGSLDSWAAQGLTAGFVPTACNFMSHEKCVRQVKTPCTGVAPSLVRVRMDSGCHPGRRAEGWEGHEGSAGRAWVVPGLRPGGMAGTSLGPGVGPLPEQQPGLTAPCAHPCLPRPSAAPACWWALLHLGSLWVAPNVPQGNRPRERSVPGLQGSGWAGKDQQGGPRQKGLPGVAVGALHKVGRSLRGTLGRVRRRMGLRWPGSGWVVRGLSGV